MRSSLPADFDAVFYLETYEDVRLEGCSARDHYISHGRQEHRYFSRHRLDADKTVVERRGNFDPTFFCNHLGKNVDDPVRNYLLFSSSPPNDTFDAEFFRAYYADTLSEDENAYAFYCVHRHKDWCYANAEDAATNASTVGDSRLFDADFYKRKYLSGRQNVDPATHYLVEGFRAFNDPSERLHGRSFALTHPDLVASQINPLIHWASSGRHEGRAIIGTDFFDLVDGGRPHRSDLDTIIVVSHEASRTGAPVVVLSLLRHLAERFNIVVLTLQGGSLLEEFRRNAVALLNLGGRTEQTSAAVARLVQDWSPKAAILNTIVSGFEVRAFVAARLTIVTLVHDFAVYVRPIERMLPALTLSDAVVFPAQVVRDSALTAAAKVGAEAPLSNLIVLPQGRSLLPPSIGARRETIALDYLQVLKARGARLVMGAGFVQPRKGIDLFIETARQVCAADERFHFVWVGAGYDPTKDASLSVYLEDQIHKSGLEARFTWVAEVTDLSPLLSLCQAFFLSSRLDPFPNVALDAAAEGVPVVCFEGATGIADLADRFSGLFIRVPYQDCAAAADALREADIGGVQPATRADYATWSHFQRYADKVGDIVDAEARKREDAKLDDAALADGEMDAPLFERSAPDWLREGSWGVAATVPGLVEIAGRLHRHGFDGALLRPGRLSGRRGDESYRRVELAPADSSRDTLPCVVIVRDMNDMERVARVLFDMPNHGAVATLVIPRARRDHKGLVEAAQTLRAGVVVTDAASIIGVVGLTSPVRVWLASGDTATSAAIRLWDQTASTSLVGQGCIEALLVEADGRTAGSQHGGNEQAPTRLAGLPAFLVDDNHLWFRTLPEPHIAQWLAETDASLDSNAAIVQALMRAAGIADGAVAVIDRSARRREPYGKVLYGRDFVTPPNCRPSSIGPD